MNIAVDAMGGDFAPREIVLGAVMAAPEVRGTITLVGNPDAIAQHLPSPPPANLVVHPASEVIGMHEKPIEAIRKRKDSSLLVAVNLVKDGKCQAVVSAGNTGAANAASLLAWRQIPGIHRPAIASQFPNPHGHLLLLDAGASPDVDPEHLVEFALMGRAYVEKVFGRENPRVRLLNIGEEEGKGNAFAREAYSLLATHSWFDGNIEGKDLFRVKCDVVVCDAFVGNIVLKTSEGVAEFMLGTIRRGIPSNPVARLMYLPLKRVLAPLRKEMDYAEYGGSPLLGLNGMCIISHGRSNAKAIKNAIHSACVAVEHKVVDAIRQSIANEWPTVNRA